MRLSTSNRGERGKELEAKKSTAAMSSLGPAKDSTRLPQLVIKDTLGKKMKKNDKKKSSSSKKRGHSNSDDADKVRGETVSSSFPTKSGMDVERPTFQKAKVKGQPSKPRTVKGSGRIQEEELSVATPPDPPRAPPPGDSATSSPAQDSLRWEGALDDPAAEEERLEAYRANRRRRYYLIGPVKPPGGTTSTLGQDRG